MRHPEGEGGALAEETFQRLSRSCSCLLMSASWLLRTLSAASLRATCFCRSRTSRCSAAASSDAATLWLLALALHGSRMYTALVTRGSGARCTGCFTGSCLQLRSAVACISAGASSAYCCRGWLLTLPIARLLVAHSRATSARDG
jgi:hypothetical protein